MAMIKQLEHYNYADTLIIENALGKKSLYVPGTRIDMEFRNFTEKGKDVHTFTIHSAELTYSGWGTTYRRAVLNLKRMIEGHIRELQQVIESLPDMPTKDSEVEIVEKNTDNNREDYADDAEIE